MIIREASDLHTEFYRLSRFHDVVDKVIPHMKGEDEMVLVLAGDIIADFKDWYNSQYMDVYTPWIQELCNRHRAVVYVGGNHEGYNGKLSTVMYYWKMIASTIDNFHFLENDQVIIDDVRFLGTTLWTKLKPTEDVMVLNGINDFDMIDGFSISQWNYAHEAAKTFLVRELANDQWWDGKTVVVTHHTPSFRSVPEYYEDNRMNCAYSNNLDELVAVSNVAVWFHGHTHNSFDYEIEGTRVICNPYGYLGHLTNDDYDPEFTVEV